VPTPPPLRRAVAIGLAAGVALALGACSAPPPRPDPTPTGVATVDGQTTPPTAPPVTPTEQPAAGFVDTHDDYQVLTVTVPATWDDVDGSPFTTDNGTEWASLAVSPDLARWRTSWGVPGIELAGTGIRGPLAQATVTGLLGSLASLYADCEQIDERSEYDDGVYVGLYDAWRECAGSQTSAFAVVATNTENTHIIYLHGTFVSDEDKGDVLDAILASFRSSLGG